MVRYTLSTILRDHILRAREYNVAPSAEEACAWRAHLTYSEETFDWWR